MQSVLDLALTTIDTKASIQVLGIETDRLVMPKAIVVTLAVE